MSAYSTKALSVHMAGVAPHQRKRNRRAYFVRLEKRRRLARVADRYAERI
jgi:hypothetical protein